jgi:hypothetical protein
MSESPEQGKILQEAAEAAWDQHAEEAGIDDFGDPIVVDDDGPAIVDEVDDIEDGPALVDTEEDLPIAAEGEEVQTEEPEELAPIAPHTWSQEWKDDFNALPPEGQKLVMKQNDEFNKAFTGKMTDLAMMRREQEGVRNALQPHMEWLQLSGLTPEQTLSRALGWEKVIQNEGAQGIMKFAQARGIDLTAAVQSVGQEEQYLTPTERAIRHENDELRNQFGQMQNYLQGFDQQNQNHAKAQRDEMARVELDGFMDAKDEAGNQMHPYIQELAPRMTELVQGNNLSLEQSYYLAAQESPDIQRALNTQRKAARSQTDRQRADKVRKASKTGIVTKSAGKAMPGPKTTEQSVEAAYNQTVNAR